MKDIAIQGAAHAAAQQSASREAPVEAETEAAAPVKKDEEGGFSSLLSQGEEEAKTLVEMIQEAQEKAEAQREALKLPKNSTRYGDAPLEAYARLARARSTAQVNSATGYARRRLAQFKTALHTDSENSARIKAAISQLQKAVNRGAKKKRDLTREQQEAKRKAQSEEEEQRKQLELRRRQAQRTIREAGYLREAHISDQLATQITVTQMELRQQAQSMAAPPTASYLDAATQQYVATAAAAAAPAPTEAICVQG